LEGSVAPAPRSPADLAPASVPEAGLVVLLSGREALAVTVSEIGCRRPGPPQVFNDLVYVPCPGDGRVVVLDRTGARAAEDILVPGGGNPELVVDDGRLIVRTPTDGRIVIVQTDGTTSTVDLAAADVPVQDATRSIPSRPNPGGGAGGPTPPQPPSPGQAGPPQGPPDGPVTTPESPSGGAPSHRPTGSSDQEDAPGDATQRPTAGTRPSDGPAPGDVPAPGDTPAPGDHTDTPSPGDPTDTPSAGAPTDGDPGPPGDGPGDGNPGDRVPGEVTALLLADRSVRVTWAQPTEPADRFVVTASDGSPGVTVAGTQASARLTGLTCGRTVTVRVEAQYAAGEPG